jgi:hypothetical protein
VSEIQGHDAVAPSISQKIGIFRNIALVTPKPATIFFLILQDTEDEKKK